MLRSRPGTAVFCSRSLLPCRDQRKPGKLTATHSERPRRLIMLRQFAGASALTLILAGTGIAHDHKDDTVYRVFVGDHEKGQITAFDLSKPAHRWTFQTTGQVKLYPVAGGAVVAAVQSEADTVQFIRSGISLHDHGDHQDLEVKEPAAIDLHLSGPRPFHLVAHDGKVVLNYDKGSYAEILDSAALAAGKV